MERTCKVCNLTKTIEDFYINNKKTLNRKTTCKICDQLERKSRKLKNPDYWRMIETNRKRKWGHLNRNRQFNSRLKYQYGIDSKEILQNAITYLEKHK